MAKKQKSVVPEEKVEEKVKPSVAENFAYQRRLKVLTKQEGETFKALCVKIGHKFHPGNTRGNDEMEQVEVSNVRFVIDKTK